MVCMRCLEAQRHGFCVSGSGGHVRGHVISVELCLSRVLLVGLCLSVCSECSAEVESMRRHAYAPILSFSFRHRP